MKNQGLAMIGLVLLLAAASAYAQSRVVRANLPFNFIVGQITLPGGEYIVQNLDLSGTAMTIQSPDRKLATIVRADACESVNASEKTKLVFHRYRGQYFLAQIWTAGDNRGRELPKTRRESEVAMDYPNRNVVVLAALR